MIRLITIITLLLSLQGCIFVAGAAAGAAGIAAVYDHRKLGNIVDDQRIVKQTADAISASPGMRDKARIEVACFNRVVLLTGEATTPELRQQAEAIARNIPNVNRVYNEITIQGPVSSMINASDSWITTKIKSQMLATKDLKSGTIKVVTENGTVYLLGIVTREQADMAVEISRQTAGVQKVVKIFQYSN